MHYSEINYTRTALDVRLAAHNAHTILSDPELIQYAHPTHYRALVARLNTLHRAAVAATLDDPTSLAVVDYLTTYHEAVKTIVRYPATPETRDFVAHAISTHTKRINHLLDDRHATVRPTLGRAARAAQTLREAIKRS